MPDPRLRVRSGRPADTPAIVALLNQTFRTPIDAATWEWYVYGNPLGPSRVYVATDVSEQIVGVIAFAPIPLRIGGPRIADFAHHLALTPAYRDTFSFVALNRHALQAQAALGRELTIGPPNKTAYPIHKTITKWADFGFLASLRKLAPAPRAHDCRECAAFTPDFDEFADAVCKPLLFCVEKNHGWMNWRFLRRPGGGPYTVYTRSTGSRLSGYVVLKRWQDPNGYRKAHIIDLHALGPDDLSHLVAAAESYASGCDELNLWSVRGYPYRPGLEALGFAENPAAHQPLIARPYGGPPLAYPTGPCAFAYGDGDTLY
jgi:hypothetical protein